MDRGSCRRRRDRTRGAVPDRLAAAVAPRWSREEDALLRRLYDAGVVVQDIAARVGRSAGAVSTRRRTMRLAPRVAPGRGRTTKTSCCGWPLPPAYRPRPSRCTCMGRPIRSGTSSVVDGRRARAAALHAAEDAAIVSGWMGGADIGTLADRLARSPGAVRLRTQALGLWTQGEQAAGLHREHNPAALAQQLERSAEAVTQRMRVLGVRAGGESSPHHPVRAQSSPPARGRSSRESSIPAARATSSLSRGGSACGRASPTAC